MDATPPQVTQTVLELEKAIEGRRLQIVAKQRAENMGEMLTSYCQPEKVDFFYHIIIMFVFFPSRGLSFIRKASAAKVHTLNRFVSIFITYSLALRYIS